MEQAFTADIVLPVYADIACRMGISDMYHDVEASDTSIHLPPGTSPLAAKAKLVKFWVCLDGRLFTLFCG